MTSYKVTIQADRYPTDYDVAGGSLQGAVSKAIREWRKKFRYSHAKIFHITAIKAETPAENL